MRTARRDHTTSHHTTHHHTTLRIYDQGGGQGGQEEEKPATKGYIVGMLVEPLTVTVTVAQNRFQVVEYGIVPVRHCIILNSISILEIMLYTKDSTRNSN